MKLIAENLQTIFGLLAGLGIFVGSVAYVIEKYSKTKKGIKDEEVSSEKSLKDIYKEQALEYKTLLNEEREKNDVKIDTLTREFNTKFQDLKEKFGKLQGQYETEKTQRERVETILKDRNPETESFMKFMIQAAKDQAESHKEIVSVLREIHVMSKAEHDRDFKIEANVTRN